MLCLKDSTQSRPSTSLRAGYEAKCAKKEVYRRDADAVPTPTPNPKSAGGPGGVVIRFSAAVEIAIWYCYAKNSLEAGWEACSADIRGACSADPGGKARRVDDRSRCERRGTNGRKAIRNEKSGIRKVGKGSC